MSEKTYQDLQNAIEAHIVDEDEPRRLLTDWFVCVAHVGESMSEIRYSYIGSNSAPHALEGLLDRAVRVVVDGGE